MHFENEVYLLIRDDIFEKIKYVVVINSIYTRNKFINKATEPTIQKLTSLFTKVRNKF